MLCPRVLLAKAPKDPRRPHYRETLAGHARDVLEVCSVLVQQVGKRALESMGLDSFDLTLFERCLKTSAILHDLGKANSHFQACLLRREPQQALRHEWISLWLPLKFPELDHWLFGGSCDLVRQASLFAVFGHHLKAADASLLEPRPGFRGPTVRVFLGHADVRQLLREAGQELGLGASPLLSDIDVDLLDRPLIEAKRFLVDAGAWYGKADADLRNFVALVKATLIAADVAGSSLAKEGIDASGWTRRALERTCTSEELQAVALERLSGRNPRAFQIRVGDSASTITLVRAGCGTGKTVAAYLWASRRAVGRKLFFCYPTTGTATEGYRDYMIPSVLRSEAVLTHSRSEIDLEDLLVADDDGPREQGEKIETLLRWGAPVVVCTVDQVVGLIQNCRKSLYLFPLIANGAFVFDEIHQYDDRLFGALLRFLEVFYRAPMLLMTASLTTARFRDLEAAARRAGCALEVIDGPAELERIPRYIISSPVEERPWDAVGNILAQGGKVLWVCNTVERCVAFARTAEGLGMAPVVYHSRFRYCDRVERHNSVVESFRKDGPCLAVTTQVCEVSLDLSADLLVTDLAPVPSMIQRLGRLNRKAGPPNPGEPKTAVVIRPERPAPYEAADLESALEWLRRVSGRPQSQAELATAMNDLVSEPDSIPVESAWLDGGPFAFQSPLREAEATVPVIRSEDSGLCVDWNGRPIMKEIVRYAIPMTLGPVCDRIARWKRVGFAFVAPEGAIEYSKGWGAKWAAE